MRLGDMNSGEFGNSREFGGHNTVFHSDRFRGLRVFPCSGPGRSASQRLSRRLHPAGRACPCCLSKVLHRPVFRELQKSLPIGDRSQVIGDDYTCASLFCSHQEKLSELTSRPQGGDPLGPACAGGAVFRNLGIQEL